MKVEGDLANFFEKDPAVTPLVRLFLALLQSRWPLIGTRVRHTQVDVCDGERAFCWLSTPERIARKNRPDHCFVFTFGLARPLESQRIFCSAHPSANRWTHHLLVSEEAQLDEELFSWVEEAHALRLSSRSAR